MPDGIDTLSDREGHNEELIFGMVWLNLIRQDLGGPDTFPQWGRLQLGRLRLDYGKAIIRLGFFLFVGGVFDRGDGDEVYC
jgi:hypothetical protein